jgi:hypothetical protein
LSAGDTPRNRIIPADGRKAWDISADNALHLGIGLCSATLTSAGSPEQSQWHHGGWLAKEA